MIKAIIFDFGEVFASSNSQKIDKELRDALGISILNPILTGTYINFVKGIVTADQYFKIVIEKNSKNLPVNKLKKKYAELYRRYTKVNKNMFNLLDKLHKDYLLVCVSDMNELHRKINEKAGYFKKFDKLFFSHETKRLKRECYFNEILKELNFSTSEVVFVDDQKINVDVAESQDIKSIKFVDAKDLKIKFNELGIRI